MIRPWGCGVGTTKSLLTCALQRESPNVFSLYFLKYTMGICSYIPNSFPREHGRPAQRLFNPRQIISKKLTFNVWYYSSWVFSPQSPILLFQESFHVGFLAEECLDSVLLLNFSSWSQCSSPVSIFLFHWSWQHWLTPSQVSQGRNGYRTGHGGRDPCMARGIWPLLHYFGQKHQKLKFKYTKHLDSIFFSGL